MAARHASMTLTDPRMPANLIARGERGRSQHFSELPITEVCQHRMDSANKCSALIVQKAAALDLIWVPYLVRQGPGNPCGRRPAV